MKFILVVLVVCLLLSTNISTACNPPPVEVHIQQGDMVYFYDCWPIGTWHESSDLLMLVYINYPSGVAGYICDYGGGAWFKPFVQPEQNVVINY